MRVASYDEFDNVCVCASVLRPNQTLYWECWRLQDLIVGLSDRDW